jgi:hypothetical protein
VIGGEKLARATTHCIIIRGCAFCTGCLKFMGGINKFIKSSAKVIQWSL